MMVSDNTIAAEGLCDFFRSLGKEGFFASKNMAKNVLSNPQRALQIAFNIILAYASKIPKAAL